MAPDNDNQPTGGSERSAPPRGPRREQRTMTDPPWPVPASARSVGESARTAAEDRILREGEAARLALARRTAREVLAKPGALDAKRLSRLGPDGLARFVAELRASVLGPGPTAAAPPASPAASPPAPKPNTPGPRTGAPVASAPPAGRSTGATGRATAEPPAAPGLRRAKFSGWWLAQRVGQAGFEAQARRWGVLAGLVSILASLAWLVLGQR